ncbi:DUF6149 family protein [Halocatena halophila]|uniref:DUF6149 family protein n=1 Tax=Halocatena halophila TaxID=2814576 RepID=UPI002ED30E64
MKIKQTARHWATKQALTVPGVRSVTRSGLVYLHTRIFLSKADPSHRDERTDHLDALFEGTIDAYTAGLTAGYTEAEAREITHIQANFDFYNHGWVEMMEIPVSEIETHYDRYREFFEAHDITIEQPLGEFRPTTVPTAPKTPDKLESLDPERDQPNAEGGYADDVYVEDESGNVQVGDTEQPDDVDLSDAVGSPDDP